ncbi:hypothetical protein CKA32_005704 [Geitlerinema sp. FC II]|nr:hypothetical protein CKA32_005704 [Geitlerinema sp. FC II]
MNYYEVAIFGTKYDKALLSCCEIQVSLPIVGRLKAIAFSVVLNYFPNLDGSLETF